MTNAMTLQRQYSLPNCTLVLEGLSENGTTGQTDIRPVMSLLINAECHLPGEATPLRGGREFFESLVTAVSLYAQEFLSSVHLPRHTYSDRPSFVRLERLDHAHHRLIVEKDPNNPNSEERSVDLTTVQLFDLVEAIDQFVADTQTLPFWSLNLSPVPKRYARSGEPIAKQVVPASIGVSGLALAAIAFFSLPTMRVKTPECLTPGAADCPAAVKGNSPTPSPSVSPSAVASPTASASPTAAASPTASASPAASPSPDLAQLETALSAAPAITDAQELKTLGDRVTAQIRGKWTTQSAVTEELAYRIGVAKNGDIVGFKAETPAALEKARQTPLLDLLYLPPSGSTPASEPLAQYRVLFKPQGTLEVTPVNSSSAVPSPTATASTDSTTASAAPSSTASAAPSPVATSTTELTDAATLENLQPKLYDAIDQNWKGSPPFDKDLIYRVRMKQDGTIVGFQPENQPANEFAKDTPLPQLGKQIDPNAPAESAASFKVVFKPSGVLQINPWYGVRK